MDTEEAIFAWAIGKALLIVIVSLVILIYAAWAGTRSTLGNSEKQKTQV
jgi:hypothetical protein